MKFVRPILLALVGILVLLTVLPLFETDEWWVRFWDFPRLQIAALLAVFLLALATVGPRQGRMFWTLLLAGLAALGWQLLQVASYIPGWPVELKSADKCDPGRQVTLLVANVLLTNQDFAPLLRLVERTRPDVVLLLEPGQQWEQALRPLHAAYPQRVSVPLPNTYGLILLSRLELVEPKVRYRMQPQVPSVQTGIVLRGGERVEFHGVHPEPPFPGEDAGERDAELVMVGRDVRRSGRAAIVMGDLNDVAWSHSSRVFRRLSGMLDPRVGRGPYPTFPAELPMFAWPLDHIFVTEHFRLLRIDRLGDIGSDHWPMLFGLCLARPAAERLEGTATPPEVREDARDEVEEGLEERSEEQGR